MNLAARTSEKEFILRGGAVFSRGVGGEIAENALILRKNDIYTSEIFDSGQGGMCWNNAELEITKSPSGFFRFTAYCSEYPPAEGEEIAESFLSSCKSVSFVNAETLPLSELSGRYLGFTIEAFPEEGGEIRVETVHLTCPHKSYIEFLPRVFGRLDNGNLRNLLDMYKVTVDDIDAEIVNIDRILSPDRLSGDELLRLAEWVGLDVGLLWGEEKLRRLIRESHYFSRMKGTSAALSRMLEILLGRPPEIAEGNGSFTVTIDYADVPSGQHYSDIVRLTDLMKPAGVKGRLILRKPGATPKKGGAITLSDSADNAVLLSDDSFDSGLIL